MEPHMLFCRVHWSMVPRDLQRTVRKYYRASQDRTGRRSPEYLKAVREACTAIEDYERMRRGAPQVTEFDLRAKPHET